MRVEMWEDRRLTSLSFPFDMSARHGSQHQLTFGRSAHLQHPRNIILQSRIDPWIPIAALRETTGIAEGGMFEPTWRDRQGVEEKGYLVWESRCWKSPTARHARGTRASFWGSKHQYLNLTLSADLFSSGQDDFRRRTLISILESAPPHPSRLSSHEIK